MQPLVDFDFRLRPAPAGLEDLVESIWFARGTVPYTREQISPTGSTVAVIVLGDPIRYGVGDDVPVVADTGFIAGPHDRPAVNEPTGETFALGVVTTAVGCEPVFGVEPTRIRGRAAPLTDLWAPAGELRAAVHELDDPEDALDALADQLRANRSPTDDRRRRCAGWIAALADAPTRPIGELAAEAGVSHAHLVAEFNRHVGLTPRMLSRILRLRAVIADIDIEPDAAWTEIAHRHSWFDQAHFIRDFKRHTGVTPSEYVAAQRAAFAPDQPIAGSGVGFVPES